MKRIVNLFLFGLCAFSILSAQRFSIRRDQEMTFGYWPRDLSTVNVVYVELERDQFNPASPLNDAKMMNGIVRNRMEKYCHGYMAVPYAEYKETAEWRKENGVKYRLFLSMIEFRGTSSSGRTTVAQKFKVFLENLETGEYYSTQTKWRYAGTALGRFTKEVCDPPKEKKKKSDS